MPRASDPPEVVSEALITLRAHLDRVEAIRKKKAGGGDGPIGGPLGG